MRIANQHGYCLLDKKLVKCDKTTTPIELCDLLSPNGHFIHVKHRKGGSAGLSHLFSQGNVAAEVMLGDREFRFQARKVIKAQNPIFCAQLPLDGFKSSAVEIVFAILGDTHADVKTNLPFFSKVNLARVYDDLAGRNYKVSIAGIPKVARP
ncbi:MAG: hypothetical protein EON54_20725 [Alcaligenaceae bacterium]|nr:MAG: hypothetical protein EON54_20725 [Alcaligenaceae bacterium]